MASIFSIGICPKRGQAETPAPTFPVGTYFSFGKYEDRPIIWKCISNQDEHGTLLLSRDVLCEKVFDAEGEEKIGEVVVRRSSNL